VRSSRQCLWTALGTIGLAFVASPPAAAHRLDEYLQVIRVDVGTDRIGLEIDLTPGALLAEGVLATLDPNGAAGIEPDEARAYAADVIARLVLSVDDRALRLTAGNFRVPMTADIAAGTGVIAIEAAAELGPLTEGSHRLRLRNDFRPDVGVYLANALVPTAREVRVTGQDRDPHQRSLSIDFEVRRAKRSTWPWIAATAAVLAGLVWTVRSAAGRAARSRL
jgi:nickel/cobalt transporter (NicO) family protein